VNARESDGVQVCNLGYAGERAVGDKLLRVRDQYTTRLIGEAWGKLRVTPLAGNDGGR
jgi:hypothetical protein